MEGLAAGLSALAFWGFIAAVVIGGIWYGIRERQAQYATLRHIIDTGKPVDERVVERILGGNRRPDHGLKIAGLIVIFAAPGVAVLAWFIGQVARQWLLPLLGVAGLVGFVGIGLLVAARAAARAWREENAAARV